MTEKGIVYRLGRVLYWAFCIIAGIAALLGGLYAYIAPESEWFLLLIFAAVVWLMGRVIRYILAGD